jgi:two-component system, chemotaxis family, chemotaxis protein CheY
MRRGSMRRVLIVDDSNILRHLIKVFLSTSKDLDVTAVNNGKEGLDHIVEHGTPALVLLDVNMPVMNGIEFLGELTRLGLKDKVPVVIVSTEGKEDDVLRGLQAGAKAYLRKPFTQRELLQIIERVIG